MDGSANKLLLKTKKIIKHLISFLFLAKFFAMVVINKNMRTARIT
jgi:hypothetical protein